tara:strand:- start:11067 stop:11444 length:378 start_codon:yes stop_codon:yes gene_type:complete
MEEPKFNNKIEDLEDQLWDIKQRLEYVESVLEIEPDDEDDDYDPTLHPSMEDDHAGDDDYFDEDDPLKHTHDDGTEHSHEGGDEPHDHDEPNENPDIGSYDSLPSDVEPIKDDLDKIEDSLDDPK